MNIRKLTKKTYRDLGIDRADLKIDMRGLEEITADKLLSVIMRFVVEEQLSNKLNV